MRLSLTILAAFVALVGFAGVTGTQPVEAEQPSVDSYNVDYQQVEDAAVAAVEEVTGNTVTDVSKSFKYYGVTSSETDEIADLTAENLGVPEPEIYPPGIDPAIEDWAEEVHEDLTN